MAQAGTEKGSQKAAQAAVHKIVCPICKTPLAAIKVMQDHYSSKHPKEALPADNLGLAK